MAWVHVVGESMDTDMAGWTGGRPGHKHRSEEGRHRQVTRVEGSGHRSGGERHEHGHMPVIFHATRKVYYWLNLNSWVWTRNTRKLSSLLSTLWPVTICWQSSLLTVFFTKPAPRLPACDPGHSSFIPVSWYFTALLNWEAEESSSLHLHTRLFQCKPSSLCLLTVVLNTAPFHCDTAEVVTEEFSSVVW